MIARVRPYVDCAPIPGGVHVRAAQRSFTMRGKGVAPIVRRFITLLDGQRSLEEIRAGLPASVSPLLDLLLDQLRSHDMLAPSAQASPDPDTDRASLAPTTTFLEDQGVSPPAIPALLATPVALYGNGPIFDETLRLLHKAGLANLRVRSADNRSTANGEVAPHSGIVVQAGDLPPDLLAGTGARPATTVTALKQGAVGLVAILPPQDMLLLRTLRGRLPAPAIANPAVLDSRLAGLLAYETLRAVAAMHRADSPGPPAARLLHVLSNWDIRVENLTPFSPKPSPPGVRPRQLDARVQSDILYDWLAALHPEFDPDLGSLAWDEEGPEPIFPLPHAVVALKVWSGDRLVRRRCVDWGLTPVEAKLRALTGALTAMAQVRSGGDSRIVVARDAETWRDRALASALFATDGMRRQLRETAVELDGPAATDLFMMARLARLYSADPLDLRLFQIGSFAAFRATASLSGATVQAIESTAAEAVINAAGNLLSRLQQSQSPHALPGRPGAPATRSESRRAPIRQNVPADLRACGYIADETTLSDLARRPGAFVAGHIQVRPLHD
ncbi:hypothetical protein BH10PSE14_BH10PSE14_04050 [soil metagenome]